MTDERESGPERTCPWCSAIAAADATRCPACGAALAQREELGGLVIPGLTAVDPALQALDGQPLHIPKASPSQGMAGGAMMAGLMGGPVGLAALGGLAAVAASEYLGVAGSRPDLATLGQPDELATQVVERLEREERDGAAKPQGGATRPGGSARPDADPPPDGATAQDETPMS